MKCYILNELTNSWLKARTYHHTPFSHTPPVTLHLMWELLKSDS